MYQLYIERPNDFAPTMVGDFKNLEDAQKRAQKEKARDPEVSYTIEETTGSFNSYGDLITEVVERG